MTKTEDKPIPRCGHAAPVFGPHYTISVYTPPEGAKGGIYDEIAGDFLDEHDQTVHARVGDHKEAIGGILVSEDSPLEEQLRKALQEYVSFDESKDWVVYSYEGILPDWFSSWQDHCRELFEDSWRAEGLAALIESDSYRNRGRYDETAFLREINELSEIVSDIEDEYRLDILVEYAEAGSSDLRSKLSKSYQPLYKVPEDLGDFLDELMPEILERFKGAPWLHEFIVDHVVTGWGYEFESLPLKDHQLEDMLLNQAALEILQGALSEETYSRLDPIVGHGGLGMGYGPLTVEEEPNHYCSHVLWGDPKLLQDDLEEAEND